MFYIGFFFVFIQLTKELFVDGQTIKMQSYSHRKMYKWINYSVFIIQEYILFLSSYILNVS